MPQGRGWVAVLGGLLLWGGSGCSVQQQQQVLGAIGTMIPGSKGSSGSTSEAEAAPQPRVDPERVDAQLVLQTLQRAMTDNPTPFQECLDRSCHRFTIAMTSSGGKSKRVWSLSVRSLKSGPRNIMRVCCYISGDSRGLSVSPPAGAAAGRGAETPAPSVRLSTATLPGSVRWVHRADDTPSSVAGRGAPLATWARAEKHYSLFPLPGESEAG